MTLTRTNMGIKILETNILGIYGGFTFVSDRRIQFPPRWWKWIPTYKKYVFEDMTFGTITFPAHKSLQIEWLCWWIRFDCPNTNKKD